MARIKRANLPWCTLSSLLLMIRVFGSLRKYPLPGGHLACATRPPSFPSGKLPRKTHRLAMWPVFHFYGILILYIGFNTDFTSPESH